MDNNPATQPHLRLSSANLPLYRTLQKLTIGLSRSRHHRIFLQTCQDNDNTPNGLIITKEPQVPQVDTTFLISWNLIIEEAQSKLINCLIQFWTTHGDFLTHQIMEIMGKLDTSEQDLNSIKKALSDLDAAESIRLKGRKGWADGTPQGGNARRVRAGFRRLPPPQ